MLLKQGLLVAVLVLVACYGAGAVDASLTEDSGLFNRLDSNQDGVVDELELTIHSDVVTAMFPSITDAMSLLQVADSDHDGTLNSQELLSGLNLHVASARNADTFLVEASSDATATTTAPAKIDKSNDGCIICQYVVSQVDLSIKMSGVMPLSAGRPNRDSERARHNKVVPSAEEEAATAAASSSSSSSSSQKPSVFLQVLEVEEGLPSNGPHYVAPAANFVAHPTPPAFYGVPSAPAPQYLGTGGYAPGAVAEARVAARSSGMKNAPTFNPPKSNRYWDKMEWNLANNLNHVADLTLDDVCESSMPNEFYAHCKVILSKQKQVTNLIGRQFKPEDVCQRINMCDVTSYVALAVHTPSPPPQDKNKEGKAMTIRQRN